MYTPDHYKKYVTEQVLEAFTQEPPEQILLLHRGKAEYHFVYHDEKITKTNNKTNEAVSVDLTTTIAFITHFMYNDTTYVIQRKKA